MGRQTLHHWASILVLTDTSLWGRTILFACLRLTLNSSWFFASTSHVVRMQLCATTPESSLLRFACCSCRLCVLDMSLSLTAYVLWTYLSSRIAPWPFQWLHSFCFPLCELPSLPTSDHLPQLKMFTTQGKSLRSFVDIDTQGPQSPCIQFYLQLCEQMYRLWLLCWHNGEVEAQHIYYLCLRWEVCWLCSKAG